MAWIGYKLKKKAKNSKQNKQPTRPRQDRLAILGFFLLFLFPDMFVTSIGFVFYLFYWAGGRFGVACARCAVFYTHHGEGQAGGGWGLT